MFPTINLGNEFLSQGDEIDNVRAYGLLPFELHAFQGLSPQPEPEEILRVCGFPTKMQCKGKKAMLSSHI